MWMTWFSCFLKLFVYFYAVFIARTHNRNSRIGLLVMVNWLNLYEQRFVEYVPQKL